MIKKLLIPFSFLLIAILPARSQSTNAKLANEYYQAGEYEKALEIFRELEKNKNDITVIHANYFRLLIDQSDNKATEKYLDKIIKMFPTNLSYLVDELFFFHISNQTDAKQNLIDDMVKKYAANQFQLSTIAQSLVSHTLYQDAIYFYTKARELSSRPSSFALEMAAVYRMIGDKTSMTNEYITYAEGNPANISYVKNLFQNILTEEEDQNYLEQTLIQKIQDNPNEMMYPDLLIWLELQRKNFYSAFVQAKALDKRGNLPGNQSMRIGRIAFDNNAWDDAIEIFQYVIDQYPDSYNYATARQYLIKSQESQIKNQFPVDTVAIRKLANDYQSLYLKVGDHPTSLEALKNKALLHAFYLNELDSAINTLNFVINNRRSTPNLVAEAKLDLGDIYLLDEQPWESTLLYSQVEKAFKESQLAFDAKLRNAKLNYYTGNFSLAKSHLDILKLATTRTISNDAIALSLLISDNTAFDSTDYVMQQFAKAELLIFTKHETEAKLKLEQILKENPHHSITDEIYWLQAKLALESGQFEKAIEYLDLILTEFNYDILNDDAFYKKAEIYENHLHNPEKAQELYQQFLINYPGSRLAAEARYHFRKLRGDIQ